MHWCSKWISKIGRPYIYERDVDDKVSALNSIITCMLHDTVAMTTVRVHCTDKPRMTPNIKAVIQERQWAFTKGDVPKFESLRINISALVTNAKANYYKSKTEGIRESNSTKWHDIIYKLWSANQDHHTLTTPSEADITALADKLQRSFTKP